MHSEFYRNFKIVVFLKINLRVRNRFTTTIKIKAIMTGFYTSRLTVTKTKFNNLRHKEIPFKNPRLR